MASFPTSPFATLADLAAVQAASVLRAGHTAGAVLAASAAGIISDVAPVAAGRVLSDAGPGAPPTFLAAPGGLPGPVMVDPSALSWNDLNFGSGTWTSGNGMVSIHGARVVGDNILGKVRAMPAGGIVAARLKDVLLVTMTTAAAGLMLRDAGGQIITFGWKSDAGNMSVVRWNSPTSWNVNAAGDINTTTARFASAVLRIVENSGGNRLYQVSGQGQHWTTVYSEASGSFLTPTQWGIGVNTNNASAAYGHLIECSGVSET